MDSRVPIKYNEDSNLGKWVGTQRIMYKKNVLTKERTSLLNSIGFAWKVTSTWEETYQRLVECKEKYKGTKLLPAFFYKEDPKLGNWISMG